MTAHIRSSVCALATILIWLRTVRPNRTNTFMTYVHKCECVSFFRFSFIWWHRRGYGNVLKSHIRFGAGITISRLPEQRPHTYVSFRYSSARQRTIPPTSISGYTYTYEHTTYLQQNTTIKRYAGEAYAKYT